MQVFSALVFIQNLRQTFIQMNDCTDKALWDTQPLFIIIVQVHVSNGRPTCSCQKTIFKELCLINYTHFHVLRKLYTIFDL